MRPAGQPVGRSVGRADRGCADRGCADHTRLRICRAGVLIRPVPPQKYHQYSHIYIYTHICMDMMLRVDPKMFACPPRQAKPSGRKEIVWGFDGESRLVIYPG